VIALTAEGEVVELTVELCKGARDGTFGFTVIGLDGTPGGGANVMVGAADELRGEEGEEEDVVGGAGFGPG
jgi:hypothetical protein